MAAILKCVPDINGPIIHISRIKKGRRFLPALPSVLFSQTGLLQQLENHLGLLVRLGQHGLRSLLDDVAFGEFSRGL